MPAERKKTILVDEADAIEKRASRDVAVAARNGGGGVISVGGGAVAHDAFPWADLVLFGLGAVMVGAAIWLILRARKGALASAALHFEANKLVPGPKAVGASQSVGERW